MRVGLGTGEAISKEYIFYRLKKTLEIFPGNNEVKLENDASISTCLES